MNLQDKVVVITGGASGLGKATAEYLVAEKGAKVALFDLNEDAGNATVAELGEDKAIFCQTDVTSEESIDAAIAAVMDKFGAIHGDVNAAGIPLPCKILDKEVQYLQGFIDEDFFGYDENLDIELNLMNMDAQEFINTVRKWDFSKRDNAIWHYARITLLEELLIAQINKTSEEE